MLLGWINQFYEVLHASYVLAFFCTRTRAFLIPFTPTRQTVFHAYAKDLWSISYVPIQYRTVRFVYIHCTRMSYRQVHGISKPYLKDISK